MSNIEECAEDASEELSSRPSVNVAPHENTSESNTPSGGALNVGLFTEPMREVCVVSAFVSYTVAALWKRALRV